MQNASAVLDTTFSTHFAPGSNQKGDVEGANWSFLLPSLELGSVVCIGAPEAAELRTLLRIGQHVVVVCRDARELTRVQGLIEASVRDNAHPIRASEDRLPLADGAAELVYVTRAGGGGGRRARSREAELARVLAPTGSIYTERPLRTLSSAGLGRQRLWLTPSRGELRTAVPRTDAETTAYFVRSGLQGTAFQRRPLRGLEATALSFKLVRRLLDREGQLHGQAADDIREGPPAYLSALAREGGLDLSGYGIGLSAPGNYASQKLVLFLFKPGGDTPDFVVKMTRSSVFNQRLENEFRALSILASRTGGTLAGVPLPAFMGHHAGLCLVGESAIEGVPFRQRMQRRSDCPCARAAVDQLTELACTTVDRSTASADHVASSLDQLFRRFVEIYRPSPETRTFLTDEIDSVAKIGGAFPLVFQHGDPGVWNLLATGPAEVAFLDWEAAEPKGMPLWDLFYLLRSYCMSSTRGRRDRIKALGKHFCEGGDLGRLLLRSTRRYGKELRLPSELFAPLFYTCWMHRALKESTRLAPAALSQGHYFRLLESFIARRKEPALRRLLAS